MLAAPTDPRMDFLQRPHQPLRFTQFNQHMLLIPDSRYLLHTMSRRRHLLTIRGSRLLVEKLNRGGL
ncbi:hypothetical protein HMPREF1862_00127 [Varibaculum cambriense]|uniref:Uncharacterized protein n=1 Tax=Varibaculum cambriense TaxID=184870 RepID=A0AB34X4V2_9ACTO|nr:hypothetical protein HMPREF1862_00127 [Varibaculum cambriense]